MTPLLFLAVVGGAIACASDYRRGVVITAAAGLLQDPVRKMVAGQSPYLMGLVFVFFAATLGGALATNPHRWWRRHDWRSIRGPIGLFAVVIVLQALVTYLRTGSAFLVIIGFAAYLGPIAALVLGSWAGGNTNVAERFLKGYLVFVVAMASGIVLWQLGYRWLILKSIGPPLVVYDWELGAIALPSGFFRTAEVASWHCATAACVAIILAASRKSGKARWVAIGGVVTFLFWSVLIAGRRKGVAEVIIFFALFAFLQVWIRGRLGKFGGAILVTVLLGAFIFQRYGLAEQAGGQIGSMEERSTQGAGVYGRMISSVTSIPRVVQVAGLLGTGLGTGTQGAQHFRPSDEKWSIISESGLARVVAELGVPGSAVALLLLFRFLGGLRLRVSELKRKDAVDPGLTLGLIALVGANAVVFVSAHQIFGDPFVYIFLGLCIGFVVAGLDGRRVAEWRRRRMEESLRIAA